MSKWKHFNSINKYVLFSITFIIIITEPTILSESAYFGYFLKLTINFGLVKILEDRISILYNYISSASANEFCFLLLVFEF